ncbi:MAG: maltose alpha-D-glucosyltransferase [Acidobacteria bacterium]|nr:maltose alpha-D-glucosyltransferase [Acidobacteriota bacterium]
MTTQAKSAGAPARHLEGGPTWYKDAVIYELHVRAFADADGDGIGDFRGLTGKLDYLRDLGVTALWLLPFYPSPLRDDGYDIADYTDVHPSYGTLADFQAFLREAHRRGLRVITELVLNHTSDQHAWFQRARRARPGSRWREFYVWSDTPQRYADTRIIFKDFESSNWSWDPVAQAYYWHRFYSHQPDLNFDAPQVRKALLAVVDFWLGHGVDGLRLDAVPYLYEREGTNCENLPETHEFLRELRRHVDEKFPDRMLLAEANQWPEDAIAYFGDADECHMAFHFPVMPRLFMSLRMEDRFPLVDILQQTPPIPASCQWAMFLRNHDELTLEMVTDEERDYMYRVYARDPQMRINLGIRRRLAPLLGNGRRRIELMNGLLFSLPGTPVLYYGDEIGMGDNIYLGDRNGVRTPMQWTADRNAGFSRANPHRLYLPVVTDPEHHYEAVNVEAQLGNPHSLLWWTRRLIALRKRHAAFSRGALEFLDPSNRKVLAFVRRHEDETLLVVANLSRYVQAVELDLSAYAGRQPVELFGRNRLPEIGAAPYFFTLGPHSFYWFELRAGRERVELDRAAPPLAGPGLAELLAEPPDELLAALAAHLGRARWFGGKARTLLALRIGERLELAAGDETGTAQLVFAGVQYADGDPETYLLPLAFAAGERARRLEAEKPTAVIAHAVLGGEAGCLYDPSGEPGFGAALLEIVVRRRRARGALGELRGTATRALARILPAGQDAPPPSVVRAEQSNTSIVYGDRCILKLFRRLEAGVNPDLELGRHLTEHGLFANTPRTAGAIEYHRGHEEPWSLAILQQFVPNQGDAWRFTRDALGRFFERVMTRQREGAPEQLLGPGSAAALAAAPPQAGEFELLGTYHDPAALLGRRTAEMHRALARAGDDAAFAPEPFSQLYQRSLYQSLRNLTGRVFQLLHRGAAGLPDDARENAEAVLGTEREILRRFARLNGPKIDALRIRTHGDYHLGQVLYTGGDFFVIDFEGEPARTLSERRIKRSALRDVAGMMRSFHYAADVSLREHAAHGVVSAADLPRVLRWADAWHFGAAVAFLRGYLEAAGDLALAPRDPGQRELLLEVFLLEKAVYELGYELNNRPLWAGTPLRGILQLLGGVR